ncbi:hypothetical protein PCASD_26389, partial [Puccinia coronata f. sp. avenae]
RLRAFPAATALNPSANAWNWAAIDRFSTQSQYSSTNSARFDRVTGILSPCGFSGFSTTAPYMSYPATKFRPHTPRSPRPRTPEAIVNYAQPPAAASPNLPIHPPRPQAASGTY